MRRTAHRTSPPRNPLSTPDRDPAAPATNGAAIGQLLAFAVFALVVWFQFVDPAGAVSSPQQLDVELWIHQPDLEPMYEQPPFAYRALFKWLVLGATALLGGAGQDYTTGGTEFWRAFLLVSAAAWLLAFAGMRALLRQVGFGGWQVALGLLAFAAAFPVVHAYGFPTHTREDPLAYACMAFGLVFWLRGRLGWFLLTAMIGVAARETLLTLPVVYVVGGDWRGMLRRAVHMIPVGLTVVGVRLAVGWQSYTLANSLDNLHGWKEVILCILLALGWTGPFALRALLPTSPWPAASALGRLQQTWRWVLPLTLFTVLFGGIVREMRLLFLVAPWMLAFAIHHATAGRSERTLRTALVVSALLLVPVLGVPWLLGRNPALLGSGALVVYGRLSWLLLGAWHAAALAFALWPRRARALTAD